MLEYIPYNHEDKKAIAYLWHLLLFKPAKHYWSDYQTLYSSNYTYSVNIRTDVHKGKNVFIKSLITVSIIIKDQLYEINTIFFSVSSIINVQIKERESAPHFPCAAYCSVPPCLLLKKRRSDPARKFGSSL